MPDVELRSIFNRPPKAAQEFLANKSYTITNTWQDLPGEAHATTFTVARAAKLEVLMAIKQELDRSMAGGLPFSEFQKTLKPRLQALGWWGKAIDKATGEILQTYGKSSKPVELGSPRRLETIYRANMQSAYMAGRWKQIEANRDRAPYVQYIAIMDDRTRPSHAALHLRVFHIDDPIWKYIAPPNGFNCRCRLRTFSQAELDKRGLTVSSSSGYISHNEVEDRSGNLITRTVVKLPGMQQAFSPDLGWDYNPGQVRASWDKAAALPDCGDGALPGDSCIALVQEKKTYKDYGRPDIRDVPAEFRLPSPDVLARASSTDQAVAAMADAFGVSESQPLNVVKTPIDEVAIWYDKIAHLTEKSDGREMFANFVLPTLQSPYEVWLSEYADQEYRHRYIGVFDSKNLIVIVRLNVDGSLMWNVIPNNDNYINKQRQGALLHKK